jgi:putative membrane protein
MSGALGVPVAWGSGLLVLAAAWIGPLPGLAEHSFTAHMIMHVAVVAVSAPLLAVGLAGTRLDPVRLVPSLAAPIPASILELVVVWGWHAPLLHHAARSMPHALVWEQMMFLAAGLLVWSSAFGGRAADRAARAGAGIAALLLTSMHMTLLGALLTLTQHPLYHHTHGLAGLTPLEDQQLGGVVMLAFGGVSYLIGGLVLLARLLRTSAAEDGR